MNSLEINPPAFRNVHWASYQNGPVTPPPEIDNLTLNAQPITQESTPVVAVVGCGYVGSHLIQIFGRHFEVIAYDISAERIKSLVPEYSTMPSVRLTSDPALLAGATHYLVSVPTLLMADKKAIDTSIVRGALATVLQYAREGATIVIESSVSVGLTRSLLENIAHDRGLHAGMSPERVDPGRVWPALEEVPKIISSFTPEGLASIESIYSVAFGKLVCVSSPEVAEMTELYENCQRMVCIAFANEMADACENHGIDPFEVSRAAANKPFGYMPYTPSLGVGGHCIPVNPSYLFVNNDLPVLQAANDRMHARPLQLADKVVAESDVENPRVLVIGMAFKPGQSVISHSPSAMFARRLIAKDVHVEFVDPLVSQKMVPDIPRYNESQFSAASLDRDFDIIVIGMRQIGLDYSQLDLLAHAEVRAYVDMYQEMPGTLRRESRCR